MQDFSERKRILCKSIQESSAFFYSDYSTRIITALKDLIPYWSSYKVNMADVLQIFIPLAPVISSEYIYSFFQLSKESRSS